MSDLKANQVPRQFIGELSNLARRVNLPFLSLRLLHPVVSPKHLRVAPPTPTELATYAAVLVKLGALDLADNIYNKIKPFAKQHPEIYLFQSYNKIAQWNYKQSIPLLKKYIKSNQLSPYQIIIGKLNLAASFIFEQELQLSHKLIVDIIIEAKKQNWKLILGNALELGAQLAIQNKEWTQANEFLIEGKSYIPDSNNLYHFFIRKWHTLCQIKLEGPSAHNLNAMYEIRKEAVLKKHWESIRDLDFQLSTLTINNSLLEHVYYGTPYTQYRRRIKSENKNFSFNKREFLWHRDNIKVNHPTIFHVQLGLIEDTQLKYGQQLHRLLSILCSDFYKPQLMGSIFYKLYPGEYFNPISSPKRVTYAVQRLRKWFKENHIPAEVVVQSGQYRLISDPKLAFLVNTAIGAYRTISTDKATNPYLKKLKVHWPKVSFTSRDAEKILGLSHGKVHALLKNAVEESLIYKVGSHKNTRYCFSP